MIIIIDYGYGNIRSVKRALQKIGYDAKISNEPAELKSATLLILPGQGSFKTASEELEKQKLAPIIKSHIKKNKPFIGICLGFQILFETSEESPLSKGLDLFPGKIKKFSGKQKVPQIGWNQINIEKKNTVAFSKTKNQAHLYFVHSYFLEKTSSELVATTSTYEQSYISAIETKTLLATQFHPEKSGSIGLNILKTFIDQQNV